MLIAEHLLFFSCKAWHYFGAHLVETYIVLIHL